MSKFFFSLCSLFLLYSTQTLSEVVTADLDQNFGFNAEQGSLIAKGSGSGSLRINFIDSETLQSVDEEFFTNLSLQYRENSESDWKHFDTVFVSGRSTLINDLPEGEFILKVYNNIRFDQEIPRIYLPSLWHPDGEILYSLQQVRPENLVHIESGVSQIEIDFQVTPAALLMITNETSNGDILNYFEAVNSEGEIYRSSSIITSVLNGTVLVSTKLLVAYLPEGDYRFYTNSSKDLYFIGDESYVNEIYGAGECYSCKLELLSGKGEIVSLEKFVKTQIDFNPAKGATVTGSISYEETENPTASYSWMYLVTAYDPISKVTFVMDEDSETGDYFLDGLAEGEYFARFNRNGYIRKSLGDAQCPYDSCRDFQSRPIRIKSGESMRGVNAHLSKGGVISGSVVDAQTSNSLLSDNSIFRGVHFVEILDESLNVVGGEYVRTDRQNSFYLQNTLPAGKYYVKTGSTAANISNRNYVNQVYPGIECEGIVCDFSKAELIELDSLKDVTGIDFQLNASLSVSGTVSNKADNQGLEGIDVVILNREGRFVDVVETDADGKYEVRGLKDGSYYLRTSNGSKKHYFHDLNENGTPGGWLNQVYPELTCDPECLLLESQLLHLNGEDLTDVDFELERGVSMSGQVRNKIRNIGVPDVEVKVFSEGGDYIESYYSDEFGYYSTAAMPVGRYKLVTENSKQLVNQAYGGEDCGLKNCHYSLSESVEVGNSNVSGVDFELIPGSDYYPHLSGLWFNQEQPGHGLQMEVIESDGFPSLFVTWYVIKDGQPIWLTGLGPLNKDLAFIDLYLTEGSDFPPNFNTEEVENRFWGQLNLKFENESHAVMNWKAEVEGFQDGALEISRLTNLSSHIGNNDSIDSCLSGTFYNINQSGHGVMVEVLGEDAETMILTWLVHHNNEQFWLIASGQVNGNSAEMVASYTQGGDFPPDFDPNDNNVVEWGSLTLDKLDANRIQLNWVANENHQEFGVGSIEMQRLTQIANTGCD